MNGKTDKKEKKKPVEYGAVLSFRTTEYNKEAIETFCKENRMSKSELMRRLVRASLDFKNVQFK